MVTYSNFSYATLVKINLVFKIIISSLVVVEIINQVFNSFKGNVFVMVFDALNEVIKETFNDLFIKTTFTSSCVINFVAFNYFILAVLYLFLI